MKRIILTLAFASCIITSFAQKTALELLNDKIFYTINKEIPKYSDFGPTHYLTGVVIMDVSQENTKFIVDGEFTFIYKYAFIEPETRDKIIKTFKYQAEVKQILDDFSVIKVIYQDPQNFKWYKLFPANDF